MTLHGSAHHRRAARALVRRNPTTSKVLKERFSPTAIFPGMTETDTPSITDLFPGLGEPDHGHHTTPEIIISTPPALLSFIPGVEVPTTTVSTFTTPTTTSDPTPILFTSSTTSTPLTTSTPAKIPTTSSLHPSTSAIVPTTITLETSASTLISSPLPSASATSTAGVSTGAIVGGVGAGIVAVAAIGFAVAFFIRRVRKHEIDEAAGFDARDFRRSAVMLTDPPTHEDTIDRGYNPPPPSMIERRQAPTSESTRGYAEPYNGTNVAGQGSWNRSQDYYPLYSPSQGFNSNWPSPAGPPAHTLATAPLSQHVQNPFVPEPLPSPYDHSVITPGLARQPSNHSTGGQALFSPPQTAGYPHSSLTQNPSVPADDYVDLNRSSISPYQAAQYAEISRQLNNSPGAPLPTSASPAKLYATQQKDLPPVPDVPVLNVSAPPDLVATSFSEPETLPPDLAYPTASDVQRETIPFPALTSASQSVSPPDLIPPPAPVIIAPAPTSTLTLVQTLHLPALSTDSLRQEEFEFPVPPSPAISYTSRYRVDSLPPTLPEISIQDRSSVSSYIPRSPMIGSGYISGMTDMSGVSGLSVVDSAGLQPIGLRSEGKFVPAPSPLASSFTASPFEQRHGGFAAAQGNAVMESAHTTTAEKSMKSADTSATPQSKNADSERPNTVYNLDDAYGGF